MPMPSRHAHAGRCTLQASMMGIWLPGATKPDLEHHFDHLAEGLTPLPGAPKQQVPVLVVLLEDLAHSPNIAGLPDVVEFHCLQSSMQPFKGLASGLTSPKRTQRSTSLPAGQTGALCPGTPPDDLADGPRIAIQEMSKKESATRTTPYSQHLAAACSRPCMMQQHYRVAHDSCNNDA